MRINVMLLYDCFCGISSILRFLILVGYRGKKYVNHLIKAFLVVFMSWFATLATNLSIGYTMDCIGRPMTWYTNWWLLFGLYIAPALLVNFFFLSYIKQWLYEVRCYLFVHRTYIMYMLVKLVNF